MSNETVNILEKKRQRRRLLIANEPPEQKKLRLQKRREMAKIKRDKIIFERKNNTMALPPTIEITDRKLSETMGEKQSRHQIKLEKNNIKQDKIMIVKEKNTMALPKSIDVTDRILSDKKLEISSYNKIQDRSLLPPLYPKNKNNRDIMKIKDERIQFNEDQRTSLLHKELQKINKQVTIENKKYIEMLKFHLPTDESLFDEYHNHGLLSNQTIDMLFNVLNKNFSQPNNLKYMFVNWSYHLYKVNTAEKDQSSFRELSKEIEVECLSKSYIHIPYNLGSNHWVLYTIIPSQRKIYYWDSYGNKSNDKFNILLIESLNNNSNNIKKYNIDDILSVINNKIQTDAKSCGIFMIEYCLTPINIENDNQISLFEKVKEVNMNSINKYRKKQFKELKIVLHSINIIVDEEERRLLDKEITNYEIKKEFNTGKKIMKEKRLNETITEKSIRLENDRKRHFKYRSNESIEQKK